MSDEIKITAQIEDFPEIKPGQKTDGTPFKRIGFKIAGKKMSVFDNTLPNYEEFTKGDVVDVVYTVNGVYNNIQSMVKATDFPAEPSQPAPAVSTAAPAKLPSARMDFEKEKTASIVSQVIIKAVSDMICAGKIEIGHFGNSCLQLAEHYKATEKKLFE